VIDLGTIHGDPNASQQRSVGYGINNLGEVAGDSDSSPTAFSPHAFKYSNGLMTNLGTIGGVDSQGRGINDSGQVAGYSRDADGFTRAFLFSAGTMTPLPTLGGTHSWGYGINKWGDVTGMAGISGNADHAFIYTSGTIHDLGAPNVQPAWGNGINDSQQVAGFSVKTGALFSAGTTTNIPTLGGTSGEATAINNSGVMTGYANILNDAAFHAFSYASTDGTLVDLGTLGGSLSRGDGINKNGQIVGEAISSTDGRYHAFLYTQGVMYDINNLALNNMPGFYQLTEANGINDKGWITGSGITANFNYVHAFLAIPQPISPRIKGITKAGNSVAVTIDSTTSFNYQLQAAPGLTNQFVNLGDPQLGSGQVLTFPDPGATATARFYHVVIGQ
jgi:probable HAF family extracellular repeat protein